MRIALNLKGQAYRQVPVHLVKDGGQQHAADYQALNPQGLVPLLVDEGNGGVRIAQSLAILEYLDEVFPVPALLPAEPAQRAPQRRGVEHRHAVARQPRGRRPLALTITSMPRSRSQARFFFDGYPLSASTRSGLVRAWPRPETWISSSTSVNILVSAT